jgi:hypothetical protein
MGVTIECANAIVKVYTESGEAIFKVQKQNSMRVSQIQSLDYSLSFLMGSSMTGVQKVPEVGVVPLDIAVKLNIDLKEFPKTYGVQE